MTTEGKLIEPKRMSLVKPTEYTRFHIDFDWWRRHDRDWRIYLVSNLCPEHRKIYTDINQDVRIDWVDPETAEVQQVDGLQHILISHCAKQPGFITERTAIVDAIFRLFLANGNVPMNCIELSERLGKPASIILKTISGARVYKGLRPCPD